MQILPYSELNCSKWVRDNLENCRCTYLRHGFVAGCVPGIGAICICETAENGEYTPEPAML